MAAATVAANSRSAAGPLIRVLKPDDRAALRRLRARSLATDEDSFGRTAAEESTMARIGIEEALDRTTPATFALGAFDDDGAMIGMAAAFQGHAAKTQHWASVNAVYVEPHRRGAGVGRALMLALLERLRAAGIRMAKLSVIADPPDARRFHERLGFTAYGVEPDGLRLGERSWDLVLMACDLRR